MSQKKLRAPDLKSSASKINDSAREIVLFRQRNLTWADLVLITWRFCSSALIRRSWFGSGS